MDLLPPGFRFHPTDEEIITHYLARKAADSSFTALAIEHVDMNKCEPWDLPKKLFNGEEKENYFFCQRDRKYPTGMRTNRATETGYWKATGKDKEIFKPRNWLVGMKKTLVFYKGRAPKGEKTNWVMHEYRLQGNYCYYNFPKGAKDEWVVCRVFQKKASIGTSPMFGGVDSFLNHHFVADDDNDPSMPPLVDVNPSCSTVKLEDKGLFVDMDNSYNNYNNSNAFHDQASCSTSQSYPFSGFKATHESTVSGISNDASQDDLENIISIDPLWEYY